MSKFGWAVFSLMMVLSPGALRAQEDALGVAAAAADGGAGKKFTGSPITLKMKDADVREVMRLISEASGFNVVLSPEVRGSVTVSLEEVPWDQALEVVLNTLGLVAERNESVLKIMPKEALLRQKQAEIEGQRVAKQGATRITRVFPVSYADPASLQGLLKQYATSIGQETGGLAPVILVDQNTQSLIVQDTEEGIERVKKVIRLLDVQTPQVIIEAKVIDASEGFSRSLDGKFQVTAGQSSASINGGLAGATSPGTGGAGAAAGGSRNANTFRFGIGNTFSLNALLNYSEGENRAKVISTPRVLVLSGKQATITQGSNLAVRQVTAQANGTTLETINFVPYNTNLNVTPRATNDGSVFMKLSLSRDTVFTDTNGQTAVAPRNINTEVIVESGNTLVIGGVQSMSESENSAGFPFLRKIPILGWLFGSENSTNDKNELMFFVTPRILNSRGTTETETSKQ